VKLADICKARFPGLQIAGFRDGYFRTDEHEAIVDEIRASGAHILFIGLPSPFKEVWSERYRGRLQVPVILGVGGSFDVLAGFIMRAPRRLQSLGLEWLWRLMMEPRKLWKRYLSTNSEFLWRASCEVVTRRIYSLRWKAKNAFLDGGVLRQNRRIGLERRTADRRTAASRRRNPSDPLYAATDRRGGTLRRVSQRRSNSDRRVRTQHAV
jgi:N-acetylglucosaminyldiphosphoundecaprenol N-acetyl-beta-D-mannosaminyltransferase